eukprot:340324-Pleurochrysis_carterae.AAC.1
MAVPTQAEARPVDRTIRADRASIPSSASCSSPPISPNASRTAIRPVRQRVGLSARPLLPSRSPEPPHARPPLATLSLARFSLGRECAPLRKGETEDGEDGMGARE